jgi:SAM-dependent methyltransferase
MLPHLSTYRGTVAVYDTIGQSYAKHRQPDPRIAAQIDAALGQSQTVLDVGGGTGSYEMGARRYVALEPSWVMLSQRTTPSSEAPAVAGVAERLPFLDGAFDAAMAILTVHHWSDAAAGLREVRRVTTGPIVALTWDRDRLADLWFVRDYLPEAAEFDRTLIAAGEIAQLLDPSAIDVVPVPADCRDGFFASYWRRPEAYLDPSVRSAISGIALLDQRLVDRATNALRADLASGAWQERYGDLLTMAERDYGYRLVIGDPR